MVWIPASSTAHTFRTTFGKFLARSLTIGLDFSNNAFQVQGVDRSDATIYSASSVELTY
jgi:hypothetical protein